jgi:hypothetical protein
LDKTALPAAEKAKAAETILLCLRSRDSGNRGKIAELFKEMAANDWRLFADEAIRFQLGPVLFKRLKTDCAESAIPEEILKDLQFEYLRSYAKSARLYREVAKIMRAFHAQTLPVIVLKGACLAEIVYMDIALRPMGDVDLLVRKDDLGAADRALRDLGYRGLDFVEMSPDDMNEFHYRHDQTGLMVEIHWDLVSPIYPFPIDSNSLWKAAVPQKISGADALILGPEDLLLHICLHSSIHMYAAGLRDIYDIAKIIEHQALSIDWKGFVDRARRWRIGKSVFLPLVLARRLFEAELPDQVLVNMKPDDFQEDFYSTAKTAVLSDQGNANFRPNLPLVFGKKNFKEKTSILRKKVFPSNEYIGSRFQVDADSPRIYLFYPRHILGLIRGNWTGISKIIKGPFSSRAKSGRINSLIVLRNWLISR